MINLCIPFLLTDFDQIPSYISEEGYCLEPNLFDGRKLLELLENRELAGLFREACQYGTVSAFHFPTENAEYISSDRIKKSLYETIQIMGEHQIPNLVLHSNYIRPAINFDHSELSEIRARYLSFLKYLNEEARAQGVRICLENMPIIGNDGDDFDSVFVFPDDFKGVIFSNIKITWDIGHWAFTCSRFQSVSEQFNLHRDPPRFFDFLELQEISRYHFSSFQLIDNGTSVGGCKEGVPPQDGDFNEAKLMNACKSIHASPQNFDITLEISEENYYQRNNLLRTIQWFEKNLFNPQG